MSVAADKPVPSTSTISSPGRLVRAGVLGFLAGFLSGLFGVGGGIVIVPALVMALGMEQRLAHGTSLAAVLPIALSGVAGFALQDGVDWSMALVLTVGSVLGSMAGTAALARLPQRTLAYAFAALTAVSGLRLLIESGESPGRDQWNVLLVLAVVLLGMFAGTISGLLGIGGGAVLVPAMMIVFGMPGPVAKGTSLVVMVPTAIVGTRRNLRNRNADLRVAAVIGGAGVVSAFVASKISFSMAESTSRLLFAGLLSIVTLSVLKTARGEKQAPEPTAASA